MNYISFRIIFICIFLPPIMYIFSVQVLEGYLQNSREKEVKKVIIQDYEALYDGRYSIKEEIHNNIDRFLRNDTLQALGVITKIVVTSKNGELLYPYYWEEGDIYFNKQREFGGDNSESFNYIKIAEKNFQILNDGLIVSVDVKVKHNSWLTNSILILYLFSSILLLYWHYKKRVREWVAIRENEKKRIDLLSGKLDESEKTLEELSRKEKDYITKVEKFKHDKDNLESEVVQLMDEVEIQKKKSLEIDEILDEMERLEEDSKKNMALKQEKEREIIQLREEISQLKMIEVRGTKKRKKDIDSVEKRFTVIYKNLIFNKKALEGYIHLTQDFQLKAEEIIHRLNQDDSLVNIKRKFFSKKGKLNIFEVNFSYSGRIYFKKRDDKKIEIITIGTKNTQEQDITFIEGMS
ncbi:MAG: hypothetical protein B6I32_03465 [Desulfobacterium sp. 4572_20]|nr:hypothetical protein [Deltaproteobacteria bacterium]OQY16435.1 MAG: hypothetical protein B6I32_03465 [Desulfobacterium sp. 4572_20]